MNLVMSARRHKCEVCEEIFICHLCDVGNDHPAHVGKGVTPLFVCEVCCANRSEYRLIWRINNGERYMNQVDLMTGAVVVRRGRRHTE